MKIYVTDYTDGFDFHTFEVVDDPVLNGIEFNVPSAFMPSIIGEYGDPYEICGKTYDAYVMDVIAYPKEMKLIKAE